MSRAMPQGNAELASEQLLAQIVAMITGKVAMPRANTEVRREKRRVVPIRPVEPRLSEEVYKANQQHAENKTCVCGCGGEADSRSRGRTLKHYEQFRAAKKRADDPVGFDHEWQKLGLIFPPNFIPEKSYRDYAAEKDWEEKRKSLERAS